MEKKVRAWSKVSVFLWIAMFVAMHTAIWCSFLSFTMDNDIRPSLVALFVVGLGFGAMGMDVFHDWGRQKELNRVIEEYETILDDLRR